jgi:hypothetical protein
VLDADERRTLAGLLEPVARAAAAELPYADPMGLPAL